MCMRVGVGEGEKQGLLVNTLRKAGGGGGGVRTVGQVYLVLSINIKERCWSQESSH